MSALPGSQPGNRQVTINSRYVRIDGVGRHSGCQYRGAEYVQIQERYGIAREEAVKQMDAWQHTADEAWFKAKDAP